MPTTYDFIIFISFIIVLYFLYVLIKRFLNIDLIENYKQTIEPFQKKLFLLLFSLLSLLTFRGFLGFRPFILIEYPWLGKSVTIGILIFIFFTLSLFLDIVEHSYQMSKIALRRPLKPIIQALKIVLFIIIFFGILAIILDNNPLTVMGSVSAFLAFISFIFKEILLGFFAGVQLTSNDTIRIGDYISSPQLNVSGSVLSLGLTTVTLKASDETHITLGAYQLMQHPIINYRFLAQTQGREFKKRINFKQSNANRLIELEKELRNLFQDHPDINQDKVISIQFEEGPLDSLILSIRLFSLFSDYIPHDQFATQLTLSILETMASYDCFS